MARIFSQTLLRRCAIHGSRFLSAKSPPSILLTVRHRHRASKPELIVVDLTSSSSSEGSSTSSSSSDGDGEVLVMERLEDIVHRVMLQKSTPDWLPFIPGSSFWVPPDKRPASSISEIFSRMAKPLTEEESLSLTTSRGWPSSSFFTQQDQREGAPVELSVKVKVVKGKDVSVEATTSEEEGEMDGEMEVQVLADSDSGNELG